MKAFHTIAVPHKDILEGNLTLDVFAADLHEVGLNRGPDEYKDPEIFFFCNTPIYDIFMKLLQNPLGDN